MSSARAGTRRRKSPAAAEAPKLAAVIGLGYVGLPLAVEIAGAGIRCLGIDIDPRKVKAVLAGRSYIADVDGAEVKRLRTAGMLDATADFARVADADAVVICVPTPLRQTKDPDLSFIVDATERIAPHLKKGALVILESTTYPGTTEELVQPRLESAGRKVGIDLFLAFSPERVDPGNTVYKTKNTPKVLAGVTAACNTKASAFYGRVFDRIELVGSPRAAEMVKLLENTFRAVNIGLVNEMAVMCNRLGLDVWEIIRAAATKPFGFMPFYPGPGLGGHCIPVDPLYLSWKLRSLNYTARFIELASEVNTGMPRYVVDRVVRGLNLRGVALRGAKIHVLGVAYKKNVRDTRESPAIDVILLLRELGAKVTYSDPHVPTLEEHNVKLKARKLSPAVVAAADAVLILTDHDGVDYAGIAKRSKFLFDARNALQGRRGKNIERL